jgi:hypothetical protein
VLGWRFGSVEAFAAQFSHHFGRSEHDVHDFRIGTRWRVGDVFRRQRA